MDLIATNGRSAAEKLLLTSSGVLALALGMGARDAHADLIVTSFTDAQEAAFLAGNPVNFGPASDPSGFTAQFVTPGPESEYLSLTGNGSNLVATTPGCTYEPFLAAACLTTFDTGTTVDAGANFGPSGALKTFGGIPVGGFPPEIVPGPKLDDGNYFLGLDDIGSVPGPFGWLEISVSSGTPGLVQFAFEDVDGVGAPVPAAPEPGSLALFALGGSAVLAARRRRRAASRS